jgi:hypothetical protein
MSAVSHYTQQSYETNEHEQPSGQLSLPAVACLQVDCITKQRSSLLIRDKIYIAKRVEYFGGEVQGLTSDGEVALTLLCFMVKSLASEYRDLVAIYPICKLTGAKQYECYKEELWCATSI